MNEALIQLTALDLAIAAMLVALVALLSHLLRLGVSRSLLVAAGRTAAQLALVGLVLRALFANATAYWVAGMGLIMVLVAGREVTARQKRGLAGGWGYGLGAVSMFLSSSVTLLVALFVLVQPEPVWRPQYAIPLLGMLLGNTMNGVALALDRLTDAAWRQREQIEGRLMLGHPWHRAIEDMRRDSMRAGMIPIVNAMAAAGIVSLPGMMTGQILSGTAPADAVRYQILIMFLIAVGTGLGTLAAVWLGARRLFDDRERLRLDRLRGARADL